MGHVPRGDESSFQVSTTVKNDVTNKSKQVISIKRGPPVQQKLNDSHRVTGCSCCSLHSASTQCKLEHKLSAHAASSALTPLGGMKRLFYIQSLILLIFHIQFFLTSFFHSNL